MTHMSETILIVSYNIVLLISLEQLRVVQP